MTDYIWKAGDYVFVPSARPWGGNPGRVAKIDRVTPSGRAYIGTSAFDKTGRKIGDKYGDRIVPLEQKHKDEISLFAMRLEVEKLAEKVKWRHLTADQIVAVTPILKEIQQ